MEKIKAGIGKLYRFIWYDLLQRDEPFTWQFCRMQEKRPFVFWTIFLALGGIGWNYIFTGEWWQKVLAFVGLMIGAWFIGHIVDSIQEHGHEPND